ncbi:Similar to NUP153: Nuclear pore complex protein Nup153 (Homo sapiens) [Cotesia congregata]|uniref:Nuclear pore complex protein Nup153 n=1 Tax=Cotesia congregata TaxID=51543 RepID=A0A8J2MK52_COTCN|nr:Similar to NUP153: Nuclear pore complex protein Nup153 (Homo sapiens) [Cotesia congregata]
MAKRNNNNSAGRRSYGEKPYDVNNSFVKKMATRVTDLIPQRSWISKWFNSPGNGLADQDTEEQDVEEESLQPPSKRPCIRLDVTHPSDTFKIQSRNRTTNNFNANTISNHNINYTARRISTEHYEDADETMSSFPQPIAGSSRSFVASTPTLRVPVRLTHTKSDITPLAHQQHQQPHQQHQSQPQLHQQHEANANGVDDNSESSESTSGCSSLIPQTSRQDGLSNFIIYPFASNKKLNSDNKLSFTDHLQSKSLLFNGRDSLSSRRPSFNASMVSNDNSPLERAAGLSSPFYSGNTTFGGSNAIGNFRATRRPGQINDFQLRVPKRSSVRVKPSNSSTTDVTGMSQTAKRILETLEHFSSPITDAKKIPVKTPLSTFASRKRAREEESSINSTTSNVAPIGLRHLTRELAVPTVPDMLKLKRRQRLTNTTLAARKIVSAHSEPAPQVKSNEYHLRTETDDKKFMGKLRAKGKKKIDEEPKEELNLAHIPLPITTLPTFDIPISEVKNNSSSASSSVINNINKGNSGLELETKKTNSPSKETGLFKFSSPIKLDGANTSLESDGQKFTFSKPINLNEETSPKIVKPNFNFNSTSQPTTNFLWSGSSTAPRPKEKKIEPESKIELQPGSVLDVLVKKSDKAEEIWECRECFIKNNDSNDQCVACKARKSDSKVSNSSTSSSIVDPSEGKTQFGMQFKLNDKWECESCLVRNPATEKNCLSCSTQRQDKSSKSSNKLFSSFSSKVETAKEETKANAKAEEKKPDGTWECPGCMLKNPSNVITCPCCNASKPGLVKTVKNSLPIVKIQQNAAQKWECPSCMVRNELTALSCVCCETPCPNKSSKTKSVQAPKLTAPITSGFGDKFKKPPGSWTCDACMVQNKAEVTECVSCSTLKPGAAPLKKEEEKKEAPKFTFGIPAGAQLLTKNDEKKSGATNGFTFAPPMSQPFTFGIPKTSETEPTSFKFSSPTTIAPKATEIPPVSSTVSGFTFGVPKAVEKVEENKPVFSFGTPKIVEKEKVFSNPATSVNSQEKDKTEKTTPGFSFVSPENVASASCDVGASSTVFTFSEPKNLNTTENIKFGQSQPVTVAAPVSVAAPVTTSGFSFTSPKFADSSSAPPEKKAAISFGSSAPTPAPVFGLNSAAKPEEKSSSLFEIADKSKTPFGGLEKKSTGFGDEKTVKTTFGGDKPMFSGAASTAPTFGSAPSVPTTAAITPSLFGSSTAPQSSIFGTGTPNFGSSTGQNIFSAKPADTPAPAASNSGLFSFGATSGQNTQNSTGGFNFSGANTNNTPQKPMFSFGSNSAAPVQAQAQVQATATATAGETGFGSTFGSAATSQPPAFSFNAPKAEPPAFGQPSATPLPSIFNNQASGTLGQNSGSSTTNTIRWFQI